MDEKWHQLDIMVIVIRELHIVVENELLQLSCNWITMSCIVYIMSCNSCNSCNLSYSTHNIEIQWVARPIAIHHFFLIVILLNDFISFIEEFNVTFGNLNKKCTSISKLMSFYQGSCLDVVYAYEFTQLAHIIHKLHYTREFISIWHT
jgi:hypothetical protein